MKDLKKVNFCSMCGMSKTKDMEIRCSDRNILVDSTTIACDNFAERKILGGREVGFREGVYTGELL